MSTLALLETLSVKLFTVRDKLLLGRSDILELAKNAALRNGDDGFANKVFERKVDLFERDFEI